MKLPRDLSGEDLLKHLCKDWGYQQIHQVGSHAILQTLQPSPHRIAGSMHAALRVGTLNSILSAVAGHKSVPKVDVLKCL
jgi:predicted RNA binding protein YcfA (HicA-like mRNA interferase family)